MKVALPSLVLWIIEDDPAQASLMKHVVERLVPPVKVRIFDAGKAALNELNKHNPLGEERVVILSDVQLYDMSGLEFLREVRQLPQGFLYPFVVMSGVDNEGVRNEALKLGANAFVVKQIGIDEMKQFFRAVVDFWSLV